MTGLFEKDPPDQGTLQNILDASILPLRIQMTQLQRDAARAHKDVLNMGIGFCMAAFAACAGWFAGTDHSAYQALTIGGGVLSGAFALALRKEKSDVVTKIGTHEQNLKTFEAGLARAKHLLSIPPLFSQPDAEHGN